MDRFVQLHLLTFYPPSNLNRDDLGRPKTAIVGGFQRLRISSQSLKRAWRTSDFFQDALAGNMGVRTKEMGLKVFDDLKKRGIPEAKAKEWAKSVAGIFGKLKKEQKDAPLQDLEIEQLAHFCPEEMEAINELVERLGSAGNGPSRDDLDLIRKPKRAVDVALFGRMLAANPRFNIEAAVQVAHAFTVNQVTVEDDFFTAVDDLNNGEDDAGAAHMGETEFGSGLFYLYTCINREILSENLGGDAELTHRALAALTESAAKVSPTGKQNSFASRAYASFILAEKGSKQPRSLALAFLRPVKGNDLLGEAVGSLKSCRERMDKVYGKCAAACIEMNALTGEGSLEEITKFVKD